MNEYPRSTEQQPQRLTPSQLSELVSEHLGHTPIGEMLREAELTVRPDGFLEDHVCENLRTMLRVAERMTPEDEMKERFSKMQASLSGATHEEQN